MADKKSGKKRLYFNPEAAKRSAKRRKESEYLTKQLNETATEFVKYTSHASSLDDFSLQGCNDICTELFLVSSIGLKGIYSLKMAAKEIPVNFPNRISIITTSVNQALTSKSITEDMCEEFLKALNLPWSNIGDSTTSYLAPPVGNCIQEGCFNGKLVSHHGPVDATIFTLQGPKTAKKQSLKCAKCSTIYGYSMYGHKTSEGERYYTNQRLFVEVSDTTFCDRHLFELFCNLRLVLYNNFLQL